MYKTFDKRDIEYLIYYHKGKVLIKEGVKKPTFDKNETTTFQPVKLNKKNEYIMDGPWHTGCPSVNNIINSKGKIIVDSKDKIPTAVDNLKKYMSTRILAKKEDSNEINEIRR